MIAAEPLRTVPRIDFGEPVAMPSRAHGAVGDGARLVVLYDRDCGICLASARQLRRWDRHGRLELLPLQDAASSGRTALAAAARDRRLAAVLHVVDEEGGTIRAGGAAAIAIGEALPGGRIVRALAAIPPFRCVVGVGYGLVARNRHRIGRWLRLEGPSCDLPR
jgi:predicted DCC family thiol-disulfide oxidoreductase YuxK